ncbi:MAG: hypothetical protein ABEJ65_01165 [bacterium]
MANNSDLNSGQNRDYSREQIGARYWSIRTRRNQLFITVLDRYNGFICALLRHPSTFIKDRTHV